ncbi:laminin subunit alpha-1-like isoform X3 [Nycticebus coucang]|uniref:laminin subunit alpha-1-like isoform X3 n=1 Tax=Nycticebus coucang TaxID=9470 RepID=UPI00234D5E41|nr:laminin subunit alpha-1-like isoform X3 [Nycticebus coucang]
MDAPLWKLLFYCQLSCMTWACDEECVGVPLNNLDDISDAILSMNLTSIIPLPYGILSKLENTTEYLQESLLKENMQKELAKFKLEGVAKEMDDL